MSSETNRRQAQVALNVSFLRYRENGIDSNVRTDKCETVRRYTIRTGRVREAAVFLNLGGNTDEIFALSFSKLRAFLLLRKLCSLCNKKTSGGSHCGGKEDAVRDSPPQAEIALSRNLSCCSYQEKTHKRRVILNERNRIICKSIAKRRC